MYWRVKKVSPEQLAKTYGVYVVCLLSILFNMLLMAKAGPSNRLDKARQLEYETFARRVFEHYTDACFLTYEDSMKQLVFDKNRSELAPQVIQRAIGLPKDPYEMKAQSEQLKKTFSVSRTLIDNIIIGELTPQQALPVEVSGKIVKNSAEGPIQPTPFKLKMLLGSRVSASSAESGNTSHGGRSYANAAAAPEQPSGTPVVISLEEISGTQAQR